MLKNTVIITTVLAICAAYVPIAEAKTSQNTENFIDKAAIANQFEIMTSQLALDKSQSPEVKNFAQDMIKDHTQAGEEFRTALTSDNTLPAAPTALDSRHQRMLDSMKAASGKDFDQQYIDAQKTAHDEAVTLFGSYSGNGDNAALKGFATKTLPVLEQHQQHVKTIEPAS